MLAKESGNMKNICVVTGTRAEYGLLKPLLKKIETFDDLVLKLVVTGMHLSPEFGLTYQEIERDGFEIDSRIEMLLSADTPGSILKSMGVELIGFADYFGRNSIDMLLLLGDRYEIFIAAAAALLYRIPVAHIHGGETTEGVMDEALRHSITKMSVLHFTATEEYRRRVIQLGEDPGHVYHVGSLGIENIKNMNLMSRKEIEEFTGLSFDKPTFMVTYHPVTLENFTAGEQMDNLLKALDCFEDCNIIFTKANSDTGGKVINELIDRYAAQNRARCAVFVSMGQLRYFSTLKYCCAVIGNSSSGIIEAPCFHIPTVNIGDRQKGRICAQSVISCQTDMEDIRAAVERALIWKCDGRLLEIKSPYDKCGTSDTIIELIRHFLQEKRSLKKHFYDLPV